jgi:L-fuculose-phosphate aldolase
VVIGGSDLSDAFQRFETLEFAAHTLIRATALGPVQVLPSEALGAQTLPAFGKADAETASNAEKELRSQICRFVHRAYEQRLLISTAGAFSARLGSDDFVVTPRRRDRLKLSPPGIVRIRQGACLASQSPSRAARLHTAIYKLHPEIGAVINAQPVHASAFCMTTAPLSTHTIPESYVVLNNVPKLPFLRIVEDAEKIAAAISVSKCPVVLIANEGALVVGKTLLEAFDRLEVLEATAEALCLAKQLGPIVPMSTAALDELRRAFNIA